MKKPLIDIGIFAALQFFIFTTLAMVLYSGGTIHEPHLESYSFLYNFFSDLGRTRTFDGAENMPTYLVYITSLTIAGAGVVSFNLGVPFTFQDRASRPIAIIAGVFGVIAGLAYIGTAFHPWNVDYWGHTRYVRFGFIAFMLMSIFYAVAAYREEKLSDHYGHVLLGFGVLLGIQIIIMLFGPRSYRSNEALFIQATAQKIVVYGEILSMLYFCFGIRNYLKSR